MKAFRANIGIISLVLILSGCSGSSESDQLGAVLPEPTPTEIQVNLEAKKLIKLYAEAYIDYNCSPIYGKWKDPDPIPGIPSGFKEMNVYNPKVLGVYLYYGQQEDQYFLINDANDSTYGNFALRTIYFASLYHSNLSGLYSHIYDIYSSEMKSVRKDYSRFRKIADKSALKICDIAKRNLDSEIVQSADLAKVQAVYDELEANWVNFNSWVEAVDNLRENIRNDIDASITEMTTPICNEYPTADGKYVVVKCTVP
jgi:hypothetical protein